MPSYIGTLQRHSSFQLAQHSTVLTLSYLFSLSQPSNLDVVPCTPSPDHRRLHRVTNHDASGTPLLILNLLRTRVPYKPFNSINILALILALISKIHFEVVSKSMLNDRCVLFPVIVDLARVNPVLLTLFRLSILTIFESMLGNKTS
jgi:hypothetical protein